MFRNSAHPNLINYWNIAQKVCDTLDGLGLDALNGSCNKAACFAVRIQGNHWAT
jgi:hypothetical protein